MIGTHKMQTLGELVDEGKLLIQTGPFGSQLHKHDYCPLGVPVVPTEAIGHRRLRTDGVPQIKLEKANELGRHRLKPGDILFARRGVQATGYSAIVEPQHEGWICGTGAILLRILDGDIDPTYLSFRLAWDESIAWLKQHAVGAVMPNLNEGILRRFPLELPPLIEQRRIADILGSIDDKIELNRRMNETLESLARRLFKSWFVDFDPVHAKAAVRRQHPTWDNPRVSREALPNLDPKIAELFPDEFEESTLGPIPKGWSATTVPNAIEVNPSRTLPKGVEAPWLEMANMPTRSARALAWERRPFGSGTKFKNGDTLVARITPCLENGKTAYVDFLNDGEIGAGSTEYIVLCPKDPLPAEFGYFLARNDDFRQHLITNMTGTSGRQRVPANCLNTYPVIVPSNGVADRFGAFASMALSQMKQNDEESLTLTAARDRLLPVLLSGRAELYLLRILKCHT
ncbi:MAG: restriction endonuclease subunit S [Pirellulales bacterium]|nr:restriction endonuclease subunit S [Pirellulales bacterium]